MKENNSKKSAFSGVAIICSILTILSSLFLAYVIGKNAWIEQAYNELSSLKTLQTSEPSAVVTDTVMLNSGAFTSTTALVPSTNSGNTQESISESNTSSQSINTGKIIPPPTKPKPIQIVSSGAVEQTAIDSDCIMMDWVKKCLPSSIY